MAAAPTTPDAPDLPPTLTQVFADVPFAAHATRWDDLYRAVRTPWDRAGPSLALADLLAERPDLVPPPRPGATALVPGCGPGHDVILLSALGYHVVGLDYSSNALRLAEANRRAAADADARPDARVDGLPAGRVTWLAADFFDDAWSVGLGTDGSATFDLVFDYTFLCALPPEARPRWAKRISDLVHPKGRLVCLEFPTTKPLSEPGPPWGLSPELYETLLAAPGEAPEYVPDGNVVATASPKPREGALHRLSIIKPARTHRAGTAEDGSVQDFISVWAR